MNWDLPPSLYSFFTALAIVLALGLVALIGWGAYALCTHFFGTDGGQVALCASVAFVMLWGWIYMEETM